jgi:hypothetical protein
LTWQDVAIDASNPVVKIRREMEQEFGKGPHAPPAAPGAVCDGDVLDTVEVPSR